MGLLTEDQIRRLAQGIMAQSQARMDVLCWIEDRRLLGYSTSDLEESQFYQDRIDYHLFGKS